jgi:hypothetical protein
MYKSYQRGEDPNLSTAKTATVKNREPTDL